MATSSLPKAVIRITEISGCSARTCWTSSSPPMSGMTRSVRMTEGASRAMAASPSRPSVA